MAEKPMKIGRANRLKGAIAVNGKLSLTDSEIVFEANHWNFPTETAEWSTASLVRAFGGKRMNEVDLEFADGSVERFIVFGRKRWLAVFGGLGS